MPNGVSVCRNCNGKGWFYDTTYDRTGALTKCSLCYGTGMNSEAVKRVLANAFDPYLLPKPKE